ncbi:MAG: hypothetical protein UHN59_03825 [Bacteroidales bacterium]|nr:hypothetical protein [Bacteroidales bacterium]MEE1338957.1 hypothetical protein [Muribaculaceae bacterium]
MKKLLLLIVLLSVNFNMFASKKNISLREIDPGRLRELVMKPEVWYDTEEHIIDVTMHSVGVLTVYYADGETVHSVNNLTFDLNKVFCEKDCNLIILETADGIVYEGYLQEEIK